MFSECILHVCYLQLLHVYMELEICTNSTKDIYWNGGMGTVEKKFGDSGEGEWGRKRERVRGCG